MKTAVLHAVERTVDWLFDRNYRNVLIEISNECNINYDHPILAARPHSRADRPGKK